jgi:type IX secretion system PorP/SprF family membrane protein
MKRVARNSANKQNNTKQIKKLTLVFVVILMMVGTRVYGQADIGTSTHWYNRANYNPATISRPGYIYFFSNVRQQWVGIDGAPSVYNVQASGFSEKQNSAYGVSMIRDDIGLTSAVNPSLLYAHVVGITDKINLSLGLSLGMYSRQVNASQYEAEIENDPTLDYTDMRYTSPDANVGFEVQGRHFLAGVSANHLFAIWKPDDQFLISDHYYMHAIYRNSDSEVYNFTGGIQVANRNKQTVVSASAIMRFKRATGLVKGPTELFDLGFTFNSTKQIVFIGGLNLTPNMRIGYAYDFDFSHSVYQNGTHEIVLEYRIKLRTSRNTGYIWYD